MIVSVFPLPAIDKVYKCYPPFEAEPRKSVAIVRMIVILCWLIAHLLPTKIQHIFQK